MELIPHGIGSISLGMSPAQVESILGRHHTYEEWMGGNLNDSLLYPGIVISFNHSDGSGPLDDSQANEIWIPEYGWEICFDENKQVIAIYLLAAS